MSDFLTMFDRAINEAVETGEPGLLVDNAQQPQRVRYGGDLLLALFFPVTARTMHPAFMAVQPKKHDPERDRG